MKKLAIVCTGGGTRCAFAGGFLVGLGREFATEPSIIVAASGSAGNACYFASKQFDEIERIWKRHLATKRFFTFFRVWKMMDIDYLVDIVFKKAEPLDTGKLKASEILIRVPLLNMQTKQINYVNPKENNTFDLLRASKAMPLIYGRRVYVDGNIFMDGALVASIEQMINEVELLGATHIIVVENRVRSKIFQYAKKMIGYFLFTKTEVAYSSRSEKIFVQDDEVNSWFATTKPKELSIMFDSGYSNAKNNPKVREFLEKFSELS